MLSFQKRVRGNDIQEEFVTELKLKVEEVILVCFREVKMRKQSYDWLE